MSHDGRGRRRRGGQGAGGRACPEDGRRGREPVPAGAAHGRRHDDAGENALPHESLAPITLAAGIGLLAFGLLTSLVFSLVGLAVMAWALGTWIGEMRHG